MNGSTKLNSCDKHLVSRIKEQEAQLLQRDSASTTHVFLGSLTDRALH